MGTIRDQGSRIVYKDKALRMVGLSPIVQDAPLFMDDFLGDTLAADNWATNKDAGATHYAINVQANGVIRGACGATDDEKAEIAGEIIWLPSKRLIFETRMNLSAVTTVAVTVGLSDAKNEGATTIAGTISGTTLTANASDGVFWTFDTDQTTPKWSAWGVKAGTKTAISKSSTAPVAATFDRLRIEVDASGNAVYSILDDGQPENAPIYQAAIANATTSTVKLCPYVAIQARTTSSRNHDVDYVLVAQGGRT